MKFFNVFKWFGGFFSGANGNASSKRGISWLGMFFLYMLINASTTGAVVNNYILGAVVLIVLIGLGVVTTEHISTVVAKYKENKAKFEVEVNNKLKK